MTNALEVANDWRAQLTKHQKALQVRAPKDWSVVRLLSVVNEQIEANEKLRECSRATVIGAVYTLAELGLYPGGSLGQAYLVPFAGKCQLILGYKGLATLAVRSGTVSSVKGNVAYTRDAFPPAHFDFDEAEGWVKHRKSLEDDRGEPIAAYAVARLHDGTTSCVVMTVAEVNRIRDASAGYKRGRNDDPWRSHWEAMAAKTAVRRLCKSLPLAADDKTAGRYARALQLDYQADEGADQKLEQAISPLDEIVDAIEVTP